MSTRRGLAIVLLLIVLVVAGAAVSAHSQGRAITVDCRELAMIVGGVVWARTMQAKRDLVIEGVRNQYSVRGKAMAAAIAREARAAWHDGLPVDASMQRTFDRCKARVGDIVIDG